MKMISINHGGLISFYCATQFLTLSIKPENLMGYMFIYGDFFRGKFENFDMIKWERFLIHKGNSIFEIHIT